MSKSRDKLLKLCVFLVFVLLGIWSLLSYGRVISNTFDGSGATDFHSYWYSGHFLRQGNDPYQAFFTKQEPIIPVKYLDGKVVSTLPVAQLGLATTPANTAPIVMLLAIFSFFSWPIAKILWMICNLIFMLAIPCMIVRLWSDKIVDRISQENLFIGLTFWALLAARNAAGNGQTTLFVFVLMLLALLLAKKNWGMAGLALGIALSKYSLSLPLVLFLLYKQKYRIVATSLATQIAGVITMSLLTDTTFLQVVNDYILMLQLHNTQQGIHLATLMPGSSIVTFPIVTVFTIIVYGFCGYWVLINYKRLPASEKTFSELHILTILVLWTLLIAYHREYDAVVFILYVTLIVCGLRRDRWLLSKQTKYGLMFLLLLSILWMSRPGSITLSFLPDQLAYLWMSVSGTMVTVILMVSLGITVALLYRIPIASSIILQPSITGANKLNV
jgi:hypothetical protein